MHIYIHLTMDNETVENIWTVLQPVEQFNSGNITVGVIFNWKRSEHLDCIINQWTKNLFCEGQTQLV